MATGIPPSVFLCKNWRDVQSFLRARLNIDDLDLIRKRTNAASVIRSRNPKRLVFDLQLEALEDGKTSAAATVILKNSHNCPVSRRGKNSVKYSWIRIVTVTGYAQRTHIGARSSIVPMQTMRLGDGSIDRQNSTLWPPTVTVARRSPAVSRTYWLCAFILLL